MGEDVKVSTNGDATVVVTCPYHPDFPERARDLGGRWDRAAKSWTFDARDAERIEEVLHDLFGWTAGADTSTVTVRVTFAQPRYGLGFGRTVRIAGREVLTRWERDSAVTLAPGVVLVSGRFEPRGGSRRSPAVGVLEGVTLEVRDLPASALGLVAREADDTGYAFEVVEEAINLDALRAERARLVARLAEIDDLLT